MDRLSGEYKRYAQFYTIVIGFIVAAALNADAVALVSFLWTNPVTAKQIADYAATVTSQTPPGDIVTKIHSMGLPLGGWNFDPRTFTLATVLPGLPGWLITAFAASLGSAFWFDTLKRFVNVRAAGTTPEEAAKKT